MEALSKAPGAETAVGEGDKRQAELGGWELPWEGPPLLSFLSLRGGGDSKGEGETERVS